MTYQDYIDLGFERTDMADAVRFKQTGYYGFALEIKVSRKLMIGVSDGELDKPRLYIRKRNEVEAYYHILPITPEMVKDLLHGLKAEQPKAEQPKAEQPKWA